MIQNKCTRCDLYKVRIRPARFRGDSSMATILFLGDTPSMVDDINGKPFIGAVGQLLDKIIERAGIPKAKCFFTNILLCRACDSRKGANREPTKSEIFACLPMVQEVIKPVSFVGVVFLGSFVEKYYKNKFKSIPHTTLTHPAIIQSKGGVCTNLFIDNTNKLESFYDHLSF